MRKDFTTRNHSAQQYPRTTLARWGKRALMVTCLITPMVSTGCRSGRPGWNLFGRNGEPSAEMLAGSGPTLTYPAPPSAKATPEAIASIAGGTATPTPSTPTTPSMGVPGMTVPGGSNPYALAGNQTGPPAYAIPGSTPPPSTAASANPTPSYAAAAANGYAAGGTPIASNSVSPAPNASPAASAANTSQIASAPATQSTLPSGYQLAGVASTAAEPAGPKATEAEPKPNAFALPAMNSITPSRLAGGQPTPDETSTPSDGSGSGFTLPTGVVPGPAAANDTVAAATVSPTASSGQSTVPDSGTAVAALGASPTGSTQSEGLSSTLPSETDSSPAFQSAAAPKANSVDGSTSSVRPAGYTPGSTGASSGYPIKR